MFKQTDSGMCVCKTLSYECDKAEPIIVSDVARSDSDSISRSTGHICKS